MQFDYDPVNQVFELWSHDVPLKSKPRPRLAKGRVMMPVEYQQWKKDIGKFLWNNVPELYSRKTTLYGSTRLAIDIKYNNTRSDTDNAAGGLMDAFNAIIWDDDRQVIDLRIRKYTKAEMRDITFYIQVRPLE